MKQTTLTVLCYLIYFHRHIEEKILVPSTLQQVLDFWIDAAKQAEQKLNKTQVNGHVSRC